MLAPLPRPSWGEPATSLVSVDAVTGGAMIVKS
jgi:hypothetical protein